MWSDFHLARFQNVRRLVFFAVQMLKWWLLWQVAIVLAHTCIFEMEELDISHLSIL